MVRKGSAGGQWPSSYYMWVQSAVNRISMSLVRSGLQSQFIITYLLQQRDRCSAILYPNLVFPAIKLIGKSVCTLCVKVSVMSMSKGSVITEGEYQ